MVDSDGGTLVNLTGFDVLDALEPTWLPGALGFTSLGNNRYLTWSPDGSRIAFQSDRDGNWEIYSVKVDWAHGSGLTNLTRHPADDMNPAWSPEGSHIAFESDRDGLPGARTHPAPPARGV